MSANEVRKHFPACCAIADEFREVFGDGVKVRFMSEGGQSVGKSKEDVGVAIALSETTIRGDELIQLKKRMKGGSNALPHYCYGDPADVVERAELDCLGCRACKSHKVVFDRVVCGDGRNEQQVGVPRVGHRCPLFCEGE